MAFAPDVTVFPGGGVDARDRHRPATWRGRPPSWWADRFGCGKDLASALVCAALRETFEECGVRLSAEALRPWANWITPTNRPRRYNTRFFVAALPDDQAASCLTTEVVGGCWLRPSAALGSADDGNLQLMVPTRACLQELSRLPDVAAALEAGETRPISPIMPTIRIQDGRESIDVPGVQIERATGARHGRI